MDQQEMDQVVEEHFRFEATNDLEGVLGTLTADVVHDVVGFPDGPCRGREAVRPFYEALYRDLEGEKVEPLHRYYGPDIVVDEAIWHGRVVGSLLGLAGNDRSVSFRQLHVFVFRDGSIARETVWLDVAAIQHQLPEPGRLRRLVQEAFTTGYDANDLDRYMENFTPDCEVVLAGMPLHGRNQFKQVLATYAEAFSESRHTVVDAVECGNSVVSEVSWSGVHSGTLRTPQGDVPATGRRIEWAMCMVDQFEADLIKTRHIYLDSAQLMAQLGG